MENVYDVSHMKELYVWTERRKTFSQLEDVLHPKLIIIKCIFKVCFLTVRNRTTESMNGREENPKL